MVIVLDQKIGSTDLNKLMHHLSLCHVTPHVITWPLHQLVCLVGNLDQVDAHELMQFPGVSKVVLSKTSYQLANRALIPDGSQFQIGDVQFGGGNIVHVAGPCAIESETQIFEVAKTASRAGARLLRGGAYKPRTSPYSFQGLGLDGLKWLKQAAMAHNMLAVSEITAIRDLDAALPYIDIVQIGARNAQNFRLLSAIGEVKVPVLLKRGFAQSIDEWLDSAEYILAAGEHRVILCERGIRTFETSTRATLDLSAIPVLQEKTHLPVLVDPSHAAGQARWVRPLALAAIAAGADGLMIEVHPNPIAAKSDADQQLTPAAYEKLMAEVEALVGVLRS